MIGRRAVVLGAVAGAGDAGVKAVRPVGTVSHGGDGSAAPVG